MNHWHRFVLCLAAVTLAWTWSWSCGVGSAQAALSDRIELDRSGKQTVSFQLPETPKGRDVILAFRARLDTPIPAGYTLALRISVNGTVLGGSRMVNKPLRAKTRAGTVPSLVAIGQFVIFYAPDFTSADQDPHYGLQSGLKACEFELRVTDLGQAGRQCLAG
jgi:hypothetical protein